MLADGQCHLRSGPKCRVPGNEKFRTPCEISRVLRAASFLALTRARAPNRLRPAGKDVAYRRAGGTVNIFTSWESGVATVINASEELMHIIEAEFAEMPGMRLTEAQFRRLWALPPAEYQEVATALIGRGVIARDATGRYCRRDDLRD